MKSLVEYLKKIEDYRKEKRNETQQPKNQCRTPLGLLVTQFRFAPAIPTAVPPLRGGVLKPQCGHG